MRRGGMAMTVRRRAIAGQDGSGIWPGQRKRRRGRGRMHASTVVLHPRAGITPIQRRQGGGHGGRRVGIVRASGEGSVRKSRRSLGRIEGMMGMILVGRRIDRERRLLGGRGLGVVGRPRHDVATGRRLERVRKARDQIDGI